MEKLKYLSRREATKMIVAAGAATALSMVTQQRRAAASEPTPTTTSIPQPGSKEGQDKVPPQNNAESADCIVGGVIGLTLFTAYMFGVLKLFESSRNKRRHK